MDGRISIRELSSTTDFMSKLETDTNKTKGALRDDEFNSGVGKLLLKQSQDLKKEVKNLKKSLASVQDELESLRTANHQLDKKNTILDYRLTNAFIPELLKFLASAIGAAVAVSFFFANKPIWGIAALVGSTFLYGGVLLIYRK
jgi:VIT1/CCC1 family predicted Fe2+/Mn2+ transporter